MILFIELFVSSHKVRAQALLETIIASPIFLNSIVLCKNQQCSSGSTQRETFKWRIHFVYFHLPGVHYYAIAAICSTFHVIVPVSVIYFLVLVFFGLFGLLQFGLLGLAWLGFWCHLMYCSLSAGLDKLQGLCKTCSNVLSYTQVSFCYRKTHCNLTNEKRVAK